MEISIRLKYGIIFYADLFVEISIDLLVMWLRVYIWDHILSRPVHGNFNRSASDVVESLHMGSYFVQTCSWKFPWIC